jgi:hypothetical protein
MLMNMRDYLTLHLDDISLISGEALPFLAEKNVMFSSSNFTLSGSNFKISIKKKIIII